MLRDVRYEFSKYQLDREEIRLGLDPTTQVEHEEPAQVAGDQCIDKLKSETRFVYLELKR